MGQWTLRGGQIWKDEKLLPNETFTLIVNDTENKEIWLDIDDVITPGLYDIHLHIWGYEQVGKIRQGESLSSTQGMLTPEYVLHTGVFGCADAGSYGYFDWENANSMWSLASIPIKSWINVLPNGLIPTKKQVFPHDVDMDKLCRLYEKNKEVVLGFKFLHGMYGENADIEREWLMWTRKAADKCGAKLMVHLSGSAVDIRETLAIMKPGDILSHAYNYFGSKGIIFDNDGNIYPEVYDAFKRGVLFDVASSHRHFNFDVYNLAHKQQLEPYTISTDGTGMNYHAQPVFDMPYMLSKMINAGMPKELAFQAAINHPAELLGCKLDYERNIAILKCVRELVNYQDTSIKDVTPNYIQADWTYETQCVIFQNRKLYNLL